MIDPLLPRTIAAGFALLLVAAAWHKLRSRAAFATVLADYRLLPAAAIPVAAVAVPVFEAALATDWLRAGSLRAAALATAALLAVYALAIAVNLLRGRAHIGCGCGFGTRAGASESLSWGLVARNLVLIVLALLPLLPAAQRPLGALDWLTLAAALLVAALLYLGAAQLLANDTAIRSWRRRHG